MIDLSGRSPDYCQGYFAAQKERGVTGQNLKVWWIPQVPMNPFEVPVESLREADLLLETLAAYDLFQLEHHVKPDYSNVGGLMVLEDDGDGNLEWVDWYDEETGDDFDTYRDRVWPKTRKEHAK